MHKKLAEAALFMATKPLGLDELGKIMGVNSLGFVKQVMEDLQKEYEDRGMDVVSTTDGWALQVKQDILPKVAHLTPYHDLSEGTKRTLALVVYKEPIKQSKIIETQGNKAYSYIKDLKKKGLIKAEKDGRTRKVYLTPEFERYFGEEKKKIREKMEIQIQKENTVTKQQTLEMIKTPQLDRPEGLEQPKPQSTEHVPPPEEPQTEIQKVVTQEKAETKTDDVPPSKNVKESKRVQEIKARQNTARPVMETGEISFDRLKERSRKK